MRSPTAWEAAGYFCMKYSSPPVPHPPFDTWGPTVLGRRAVAWSNGLVTLGTSGLAASTVPPKLSSRENPPTSAKSRCTASAVYCLLSAPVNPSSYESTLILRPLIPPREFT